MASKTDLDDAIKELSKKIEGNVNTINGVLSHRLTSVTLVPSVYVDGIPSIVFSSANYTPMVLNASTHVLEPVKGATAVIVSNESTEAKFRLNPATVTKNDIKWDKIAFANDRAQARSTSDTPVKATASDISEGILTVKATKAVSTSLKGDKDFWIVALRVPLSIKDKDGNEDPTYTTDDAVVYS
ncbi:MAG: hypothetical protein PHR45_03190 [Muribaculaceae bacterium]|nr:hypothetical protein [Muribaculaceae bacterium]